MTLTIGLLMDFFEENELEMVKAPSKRSQKYEHIRLYYPGAAWETGCLYLLDAAEYTQIDGKVPEAPLCIVTKNAGILGNGSSFVIRTPRPAAEVFCLLQARLEELARWDLALSELLLRDASLEELLACSAPVLDSPCLLQDANFQLLAAWGQVGREENLFFSETLRTGRAPRDLFLQLLSMRPPEQPYASPKAISSRVKDLSDQRVLIADCCVNNVAVLHFCLYYGAKRRQGLADLIVHLMQRMEMSPSVRRLTSKSTDLHDALFTKLFEAPKDPGAAEICSTLGLLRFQQFTAVCIEFGVPHVDVVSKMTKLRALYPRYWFFRYQGRLYALLGSNPETRQIDELQQQALLQQLANLGASYGTSLDQFTIQALSIACSQAAIALELAKDGSAAYADVLVRHILRDFYGSHEFHHYCPAGFLQLLEDDGANGTDNLALLSAYLANNCNATAVSRILHMHRNNVIYRMERIKAKYHFDLSNGSTRLLLQLLAEKAAMGRQQETQPTIPPSASPSNAAHRRS